MSLYPQSQAYGQMQNPPMGYPQPVAPPGNYHYPPPPPAQPYHVDPHTFRRDYTAQLAELTVNSRPIIQNLSMIAQDHTHYADVVTQCIEAHIRRVPPWMKLPAFYLLDAISKNVYDPYARHFSTVVVRLFIDTYEQVDPSTRSKMIEMLTTWRNGAPSGKELFGVITQLAIERHIWPDDASRNVAVSSSPKGPRRRINRRQRRRQSSSRSPPGSSGISAPQVLSELEIVLNQKERAFQLNPYDKVAQNQIAILHQLRKLVVQGVSQEELGQILHQMRTTLSQPQSVPPPAAIPPPSAPMPPPHYGRPPFPPGSSNHLSAAAPQVSYPPAFSQQVYQQPKPEQVAVPDVANVSTVPPPPPVENIASIFSALVKAGLVTGSSSSTPTGAGATAREPANRPVNSAETATETDKQYRKAILSAQVKLNSADIIRQRTVLPQFLYDQLPGQCKHCGIRFSDSSIGKQKMQDHMDMHFRQNRKAGQATGRGHSRGWFISVEDWTNDSEVDIKGKGRAGAPRSMKAAAAADAAKVDAELRALYVVVPPGDEAKRLSCPICNERLEPEFMEDDEEWVWKNAVNKDDKIFHATCHAEAALSKTALAVRLRSEVSSRSRSRTPEARRTPPKYDSPSPSRGVKRKAEDDESKTSQPSEQSERTPPMKKVAISPTE
ncbi:hypothetical protein BXZ70DRAFT_917301 [Cristinia sonorae]|uniref:CID domain-containing protein n=1 Tax=Cristinia sonorae TaxID=1940300 RepID=A0A8K0XTH8_9AGAR|nr:hypothetical protein BXZ70DRAFT_917301 [Cristinia sonorae]